MQFVRISEFLIVRGQFVWMCAHGLPALIYLLINRTIRRDCKNVLPKITKLDTIRPLHIPVVCAALPESDNGATATHTPKHTWSTFERTLCCSRPSLVIHHMYFESEYCTHNKYNENER